MNVLVTGATGFIGRHLVEELAKLKKYNIFCLIRNKKKASQLLESYNVKLICSDITQEDTSYIQINEKIDIIFHTAGYVSTNANDKKNLYRINVVGTENICKLALKLNVERMVYVSTVGVIAGNTDVPFTENMPYKATNLYEQSKLEAEKKVVEL